MVFYVEQAGLCYTEDMKRLSVKQIKTLLITVLVVLSALVAYLLSGPGPLSDSIKAIAAPPATPAPTPSPTEAAKGKQGFSPMPEAVFLTLMTNDPAFLAKPEEGGAPVLYMQCGAAATGRATLEYTLDGEGCVSSFAIAFPTMEPPASKPKTQEEMAYAAGYEEFAAAQNDAIRAILSAAVNACDMDDTILAPVLLKWYTGTVNARDTEKSYADTYQGCVFEAYTMPMSQGATVVCSLLLPL